MLGSVEELDGYRAVHRTRGSAAGIVNLGTLSVVVIGVVEAEDVSRRQVMSKERSRYDERRSSSKSLRVAKVKGKAVLAPALRGMWDLCFDVASEIEQSVLLLLLFIVRVADSMVRDSVAREEMSVSSDQR